MLTNQDINAYNEEGYYMAKGLLVDEVSAYRNELKRLMLNILDPQERFECENNFDLLIKKVMKPKSPERQFIYDTSRMMAGSKKLQVAQKLLDVLKQLGIELPVYATYPTVRFDLPGSDENKYLRGPHQDLRGIRCDKCCTVWIPITECNRDRGAVLLYPGTHKEGKREHYAVPNLEVPREGLPDNKVYIEASPGDVAIFNSFLVHESTPAEGQDLKSIIFFCVNDGLSIQVDNEYDKPRENLPKFGDKLREVEGY